MMLADFQYRELILKLVATSGSNPHLMNEIFLKEKIANLNGQNC